MIYCKIDCLSFIFIAETNTKQTDANRKQSKLKAKQYESNKQSNSKATREQQAKQQQSNSKATSKATAKQHESNKQSNSKATAKQQSRKNGFQDV